MTLIREPTSWGVWISNSAALTPGINAKPLNSGHLDTSRICRAISFGVTLNVSSQENVIGFSRTIASSRDSLARPQHHLQGLGAGLLLSGSFIPRLLQT